MATLQEYEEVAPTVMATGDFTLQQVEDKLAIVPDAPEQPAEPTVTKAKIISIFNTVFSYSSVQKGIEMNGGILKIAQDNSLKQSQVKTILKELSAMLSVYNGTDDEELI